MSDFGMYTPDGNAAVAEMLAGILIAAPDLSDNAIYARLTQEMNALAKRHEEVWDTEVRTAIIGRLERALNRKHGDMTIYF
jgi:hypothetical protein